MGSVFSLARRCWAGTIGTVGLLGLLALGAGAVVEPVGIIIVGSCGAEARLLGVTGLLGSVCVLGDCDATAAAATAAAAAGLLSGLTSSVGEILVLLGTICSADSDEVEVGDGDSVKDCGAGDTGAIGSD